LIALSNTRAKKPPFKSGVEWLRQPSAHRSKHPRTVSRAAVSPAAHLKAVSSRRTPDCLRNGGLAADEFGTDLPAGFS